MTAQRKNDECADLRRAPTHVFMSVVAKREYSNTKKKSEWKECRLKNKTTKNKTALLVATESHRSHLAFIVSFLGQVSQVTEAARQITAVSKTKKILTVFEHLSEKRGKDLLRGKPHTNHCPPAKLLFRTTLLSYVE